MDLKRLRQVLKACADDTRLRILNILDVRPLTVKDICQTLKLSQPSVSKHLAKLRLLRMVADKREGNLIYYSLNAKGDAVIQETVKYIIKGYKDIKVFKRDRDALRKTNK
jgi:ArsR family transcriptional regulator